MPMCRDCGNKEDFYAEERVLSRYTFNADKPEESDVLDSETTEYLETGSSDLECVECNSTNVAQGDDALIPFVEKIKTEPNKFIEGKVKLTEGYKLR